MIPALISALLPLASSHISNPPHEISMSHLVQLMSYCVWTALPFAALALLRMRSMIKKDTYVQATSAGLLTALLTWGWVTLDNVAFPASAVNGISTYLWIAPAIVCAMLASTRLNRATAF